MRSKAKALFQLATNICKVLFIYSQTAASRLNVKHSAGPLGKILVNKQLTGWQQRQIIKQAKSVESYNRKNTKCCGIRGPELSIKDLFEKVMRSKEFQLKLPVRAAF